MSTKWLFIDKYTHTCIYMYYRYLYAYIYERFVREREMRVHWRAQIRFLKSCWPITFVVSWIEKPSQKPGAISRYFNAQKMVFSLYSWFMCVREKERERVETLTTSQRTTRKTITARRGTLLAQRFCGWRLLGTITRTLTLFTFIWLTCYLRTWQNTPNNFH